MKLAFVDDFSFESELRYMRGLVSGFRKIGFKDEITIYARKGGKVELIPGALVKKIWNQFIYPFQIMKSAIRDRQDVIHVEFDTPTFGVAFTPLFLPLLFLFLRISRKYASVTIHAVPPLNNQNDMKTMTSLLKMRSINLPVIAVKFGILFAYTLIGLLSQKIIVHSRTLKNWLQFEYKIPENKIVVIPHGTTTPAIEALKNVDPKLNLGGRKIVLFFGRVNVRKGIEVLLDAWSRIFLKYPDHILVIAGAIYRYDSSGQYFSSLQSLSLNLGIDGSVIFTGRLSDDQIDWLYLNCEFVVLPYQFSNAASGPLAIAIGFGKPVIAYAIGTFNDEIIDNSNGLLVAPGDEAGLETAIDSMLKNKKLREKLERNAKEIIVKHSWEHHARSLLETWEKRNPR